MSYSKERPFIKVDVTGAVDKKFDDLTTQLAHTVKKGENESVTWGMLDQASKENMTEGAVPIVGVDAVNTSNIVNGAVNINKLESTVLDSVFNKKINGTEFDWALGGLRTSNGVPDQGNVTRIRSLDYYLIDKPTIISLMNYNDYKFMVFKYHEDNDGSYIGSTEWIQDLFYINESVYIRVLLAYEDDREMSEEEIPLLSELMHVQYSEIDIPDKSIKLNQLESSVLNAIFLRKKEGADMPWVIGSFRVNSGKPNNDATTRIRNLEYTHVDAGDLVGLNNYSNHKFMVFKYESPSDSTFISATDWCNSDYVVDEPCYIKLLMSFSDDAEISEQDKDTMPDLLTIRNKKVGIENILDESISESKLSKELKNRIDHIEESLDSGLIDVTDLEFSIGSANTNTGEGVPSTTRIISDYLLLENDSINFIPVGDAKYIVFYYDEYYNYLGFYNWRTDKSNIIINGKKHVRIGLAYIDDRELTEQDVELLQPTVESIERFDPIPSSEYYFRGPTIPAIPVGDNALGYEDFMAQTWEDLRSKFPNYIERNHVIKDTSETFDIYEYVFKPDNYTKTVFLTAGIHGDEYEGFWGLYYFMKYICEEYYRYDQLRDLRHNIRFVIIPVLSPWGVENRVRATTRVNNANNNYDVFFRSPEYESPAGATAFSENESRAVEIIADKYDADFDFFADFHTDRYDPQNGNYVIVNQLSSTLEAMKQLIIDEAAYLKDKYGFETIFKPYIVNINRRSSSFKYMEAVRGVPAAILEVGTGLLSPIGSSTAVTVAVDWFTNIIIEMLKHDLRSPKQVNNGMEKSILENRLNGYTNSVLSGIPDEGLQVNIDHSDFDGGEWSNRADRGDLTLQGLTESPEGVQFSNGNIVLPANEYSDFTLAFKGTINEQGVILGSSGDLMLMAYTKGGDPTSYNIYNGDRTLVCSALKYGDEIQIGVKSVNNRLYLFVNGEPFNDIPAIHAMESQLYIGSNGDLSEPIDMTLKALTLYNRALSDSELGFVFKSFINR